MPTAAEERVRRIEDLVGRLENIPDRESREVAQGLMEAILELHGVGLDRMMDLVFESGEIGKTTIRKFAKDEVIASLLVLHGLHPDDMETRIQHALAKTHASAELLSVFEGVVRIRLTGEGCGLRTAVEAAVREAAPDAAKVLIEEREQANNFVPLAALAGEFPRVS